MTTRIDVLNHRDPGTAASIVVLQRASYVVEAEVIGFAGIPALHESVEDVMALGLTILAAIEDGQPIAMVGYARLGDTIDIDRLAVHPAHFRRGLARRLITAVHDREPDAARFIVQTGRDNTPAVTLYRSLGYRSVEDVELPEGVVIRRFVREHGSA
jgi:ribosomal protein S18 acetylase RimI-like enzyme